ncbi:hypothetical protein OVA10_04220 [Lelliottia sp. SL45]|uniref:hypothetical protein n=1 Tax=Lelliottia sp. SL45 TaxID=2994665 RepID=UPI0022729BB7|nr:hypothetical protein [Lelliottia sp. SL45]MCY1697288.1 hypothetical protein [Lelliottia sp. SL45]
MKNSLILFTALVLSIGHATARETIFSCVTDNGKLVKVVKDGDQAIYELHNKKNKLEISLKNVIASMNIVFSEPDGSEITTSVPFKNGSFIYDVFTSTDRLTEEHPSQSGVIVSKNNVFLANLKCKNDSIKGNLLDIDTELQ